MSLGFTKSQVALILVAGPLAGVIGQPYFGICSDQCRSPYGKRRPFIVIGTVFTIIAMLGLAWVKEIVQSVLEIFTPNGGPDTIRSTVMTLSVGFVFLLNFAIQPIQSGLRSLIVDSCPPNQLNDANAWASRMIGMSNVACYGIGFFDLPKRWSIFIETQFKALCLLASLGLAVSIAINCWMIKERNSSLDPRLNVEVHTLLGKMRHFCSGFRRVSPQIMRVCHIQCFAWIGWFLFYCYITM
jgi:solute carrier family 45 protein 1/2/4